MHLDTHNHPLEYFVVLKGKEIGLPNGYIWMNRHERRAWKKKRNLKFTEGDVQYKRVIPTNGD